MHAARLGGSAAAQHEGRGIRRSGGQWRHQREALCRFGSPPYSDLNPTRAWLPSQNGLVLL
jgi:hypothetical protein